MSEPDESRSHPLSKQGGLTVNEGFRYPWIVKRDIDGFFGLAIDNLF
jgi:hypothetical protein